MSVSQTTLIAEYGNLEKVHFLTDLPLEYRGENTHVFRYMQYPDLKLSLLNKSFAFMSPNKWEDLYEQRFWKTDYSALNPNFKTPNFACLCITPENRDDSAASWKMYRKEEHEKAEGDYDNNLVRLTLNFKLFITALNDWAVAHKSGVYISAVDYSFSQTELVNELPRNRRYFPQGFDLDDYFKVLSLKRPYYSFEREIRIFILEPQDKPKIQKDLLILDEFDISRYISQILVAPPKDGYKKKLNTEIVKKEVGSYFANCELSNVIKQSRQFECDKCNKIQPEKMENEEMEKINSSSVYKIECNIEQISIECGKESPSNLKLKLKGLGAYYLKKDSTAYNLFLKIDNAKKDNSDSEDDSFLDNVKTKKAADLVTLQGCDETAIGWIKYAFENGKTVELEFSDIQKDEVKLTAITVKS